MGAKPYTLYITLQSAAAGLGEDKYEWGLYLTEHKPPGGHLFTVTDLGNAPHKLYNEVRLVSDPTRSRGMTACLMVHKSPGMVVLTKCSNAVPFKTGRPAPPDTKWTSRVWVKQVLTMLHIERHIMLSVSVDEIMDRCQALADAHKCFKPDSKHAAAKVYNGTEWMLPPLSKMPQSTPHPGSTNPPMARRTDTGNLTPMDIDSPRTPTKKPSLVTRASLNNGAAPVSPARCSSPMDLDSPVPVTRTPTGSNPLPFGACNVNPVSQASTNNVPANSGPSPMTGDVTPSLPGPQRPPMSLATSGGVRNRSRLGATKPLTTRATGNGARPMPLRVDIPRKP